MYLATGANKTLYGRSIRSDELTRFKSNWSRERCTANVQRPAASGVSGDSLFVPAVSESAETERALAKA